MSGNTQKHGYHAFTPCIIALGGLDPSGGAGILRDAAAAKSVGVHCMGVATLLTVQDGERFLESHEPPASLVIRSLRLLLSSHPVGAIKTGAILSDTMVNAIADGLRPLSFPNLVVDPVIQSTSGGVLLSDGALAALKNSIIPMARIVTPNLPEAAILTGLTIQSKADMLLAAEKMITMGARAVLIKGGHLSGETVVDVYGDAMGGFEVFESTRLAVGNVRGTGCALASLIAAFLAKGFSLKDAVVQGREHLRQGIASAVSISPKHRLLG